MVKQKNNAPPNVLLEKEPKVKAPSIFFFRKKETKKPLP